MIDIAVAAVLQSIVQNYNSAISSPSLPLPFRLGFAGVVGLNRLHAPSESEPSPSAVTLP